MLYDKVRQGLAEPEAQRSRDAALRLICPRHVSKVREYPWLSRRLRELKAYSVSSLFALVDRAIASMEAQGTKVYYARTAEEAAAHIMSLIGSGLVVKSKTNTGNEIGIVEVLETKGIRVVETDLGDRVVQLAKSRPSHPLIPALHMPVERIAQLFSGDNSGAVEPTPEACIAAARQDIMRYIATAQYGLSGANAIAADCGGIFLTENEGNVRLVTGLTEVLIVIAGIEKIVPTVHDALTVVQAAAVYGLGQDIGTYVSCICGPSRTADVEYETVLGMHGPREVHVVLLDNGRSEAVRKGFEELLYCINCGSCLNFCPVYRAIGERYGYRYLGGRGLAFTAFHEGLERAFWEGLPLCTACGNCKVACPAGIDGPRLVRRLRAEFAQSGLEFDPYTSVRQVTDGTGNPYGEQGFRTEYEKPRAENVVFLGCVAAFRERESGKATLRLLDRLGIDFTTIDERCCGGVYEAMGLKPNSGLLVHNAQACKEKGAKRIITVCPRCSTILRNAAEFWDFEVRHITEFLRAVVRTIEVPVAKGVKITYHDPCHMGREMGIYDAPRELILRIAGQLLEPLSNKEYSRCCGAGSLVRAAFPRLSLHIARSRLRELEETGADVVLTECPACLHNLRNALGSGHGVEVYGLAEYMESLWEKPGGSF